jgi:hypothetical protein
MRIVRAGELPVVVRIARHGETIVAIPARLSVPDLLSLASLVLSGDEYVEFRRRLFCRWRCTRTMLREPTGRIQASP